MLALAFRDVHERRGVRRALSRAVDAILTEMVNPVLRDFPELEEAEDCWGEIAIEQARRRVAHSPNRPPSPMNDEARVGEGSTEVP
jgi:hypothetical protein